MTRGVQWQSECAPCSALNHCTQQPNGNRNTHWSTRAERGGIKSMGTSATHAPETIERCPSGVIYFTVGFVSGLNHRNHWGWEVRLAVTLSRGTPFQLSTCAITLYSQGIRLAITRAKSYNGCVKCPVRLKHYYGVGSIQHAHWIDLSHLCDWADVFTIRIGRIRLETMSRSFLLCGYYCFW